MEKGRKTIIYTDNSHSDVHCVGWYLSFGIISDVKQDYDLIISGQFDSVIVETREGKIESHFVGHARFEDWED